MIYVDLLRTRAKTAGWNSGESCHLFTDGPIGDLHSFAQDIGLRREWFQDGDKPHYDLTPFKRKQALRHGAVHVTTKQAIKIFAKIGGK